MEEKKAPHAPHPVLQFWQGFVSPWAGLRFVVRERLWGWVGLPIAVNVVLFAAIGAGLWFLVVPWLQGFDLWLFGASEPGAVMAWFSWFYWAIAGILIGLLSGGLLLLVGQAVAAPFLDLLSEHIEHRMLDEAPAAFSLGQAIRSVVMSVLDVVWALIYWLALHIPILLVSILVPVVGTSFGALASIVVTALVLAQEFVGMPMARRLVSYPGRWRVVWRHRWATLGFGFSALLLLAVPGINLVLLPVATAGGTILYCQLKSKGLLVI